METRNRVTDMNGKRNCYHCKWGISGHPLWSNHYRGCVHPNVHRGERGMVNISMTANLDAVDEGWFDFPFNFDPAWIDECKGFEKDRE